MSGALGVVATATSFVATASPDAVIGIYNGLVPTDTQTTTVTPVRGIAPFTYVWAKTSGDDVTPQSPTSAVTRFEGEPSGPGITLTATFVCTVTDAVGAVAVTNAVTATVQWLA